MAMLGILAGLLVVAGCAFGLYRFNSHCEAKFGFKFLTKLMFVAVAAGVLLLMGGNEWRAEAARSGGDILNGIVLMALGSALLAYIVYRNITKTGLAYGVTGSAIQIALFGVLGYLSLALLIIGAISYFYLLQRATPVWVINK